MARQAKEWLKENPPSNEEVMKLQKDYYTPDPKRPNFVPRAKWKARVPRSQEPLDTPVPYLVYTHTSTEPCTSRMACERTVRDLQDRHMAEGAPDILYNYLIAPDGTIYEGRGSRTLGMQYPEGDPQLGKTDKKSIVVACICNSSNSPTPGVMDASTDILDRLLKEKVIKNDVKILWYDADEKNKDDSIVKRVCKGCPITAIRERMCRWMGLFCD